MLILAQACYNLDNEKKELLVTREPKGQSKDFQLLFLLSLLQFRMCKFLNLDKKKEAEWPRRSPFSPL